ncbi:hypothetical protein [uncultured Thiohalocapsa sp.]|uniref:hypothetical protein n=1 Tax=uncultured Thiohalocapsa sp. TaxID=768990 RepID=UPI0025F098AF|nr:hypothetical protein [uncultured Thiohalocapsa sp.]
MTIDELLPSVGALSHADKLRLAQIVLQQLAQEAPASAPQQPAAEPFDPQRFYGAAHHSRQEIDQYLASAREGWPMAVREALVNDLTVITHNTSDFMRLGLDTRTVTMKP